MRVALARTCARSCRGRVYWAGALCPNKVSQGARTGQGGAVSATELCASCQHYLIRVSKQACRWGVYSAELPAAYLPGKLTTPQHTCRHPSDLFQDVTRAQIRKENNRKQGHKTLDISDRGLHRCLFCVVLQPFCEYLKRQGTEICDHNFFYLTAAVTE